MNDELKDRLWEIVGEYLTEEEQIHGLPHIRRVYSYFDLFRKSNPLVDDDLLDALEYGILFHDIGHKRYARENHALESERIMRKLFSNELSDVPDQEWILYAIKNHSTGLGGREARDKKDLCLALLVVFDHMDGIGAIGIYRSVTDFGFKIPLFPKDDNSWEERIKHYLDHPEEITINQIWMIKSSMLELLTYLYCATCHILYPARNLIKLSFKDEIERKLKVMRDFIEDLFQATI